MNLLQLPIFSGLSEAELAEMLGKKCMYEREYRKNEIIYHTGDRIYDFGVVLEGSVHIESVDLWGDKSILSAVGAGQTFAEVYALCGEALLVDAAAAEPAKVLFIDLQTLLAPQNRACSWYLKMLGNLLMISAQKNLTLSHRIFCTASKSIRGRVFTYLSMQAAKQGRMQLEIPFNRQQMADYLNVDRSALSNELGKMREEGLLTFHKNRFALQKKWEGGRTDG